MKNETLSIKMTSCCLLFIWSYEGHPMKNETLSISAVNLHARLLKFLSKLVRLFGCSRVLYSTCYIVPTFVARQH